MKIWGWDGWRAGISGWLVVAALGTGAARAQVATTTVQDTVTDASGAGAAGTVVVSWEAFTTAAGSSVAAGSLSSTLGNGGTLNVALQPNASATPMGSYYTAVFHLSDGTTSREFWVVPVTAAGTVKLASIRNQVLPTTVAMQTVSKQYVDTTVAKAMAGVGPGGSLPYLLKGGDAMTGPLTLAADPVAAMQAADKHYVDAAVAGVTVSGSGSPSGTAGGDLSGSYPNPAVSAVHATSGTLDGVAIGSTRPATTMNVDSGSSEYAVSLTSSSPSATDLVFSNTSSGSHSYLFFGAGSNQGIYGFGVFDRTASFHQFFVTGGTSPKFGMPNNGVLGFLTGTSPGSPDTGFSRDSAGVIDVGNGTSGDVSGTVRAAQFHEALRTPGSSAATCTAGDFTDDANFHYVCVASSTWKRVALSAF